MTNVKVHVSSNFFKELSSEAKRRTIALQSIQIFIDQARVRGYRVGDNELLATLDHIESFFSVIRESSICLEKLCKAV